MNTLDILANLVLIRKNSSGYQLLKKGVCHYDAQQDFRREQRDSL